MESPNMSLRTLTLTLALLVLTAAVYVAADDGTICGITRDELMVCKPAVATNTPVPPPPTGPCCASLKHANLTCFCEFKNNKYLAFFGINVTRAMQLPSKCDPTQTGSC